MPSTAPSAFTTNTRIARVPYLNSAPFFRGLRLAEVDAGSNVPRQLGERAAAGELTAALLPLVDYFRLSDRFERLGRFGIGVRGRARSVLLFSLRPIRQLDGAAIAVTNETSTTEDTQHYRQLQAGDKLWLGSEQWVSSPAGWRVWHWLEFVWHPSELCE